MFDAGNLSTAAVGLAREPVIDPATGDVLGYCLDHRGPLAGLLDDDPEPSPASTPPSGWAAFTLDHTTAVPATLPATTLLDSIVAFEQHIAWATARQQELIAEFGARPSDGTVRPAANSPEPAAEPAGRRAWAADEIGLALHLAPGTADVVLAAARRLDDVLRPTRDLLERGRLCPARVRAICDALAAYDDDVAAAVQERVLPRAPEQTLGQLKAALRRVLLAVVPDPADRHQRTRRERRVDLYPGNDGMATLSAYLTATEATASFAWITRLARGLPVPEGAKGRGSIDRRRADILTSLLTGRLVAHDTTAVPGTVHLDDTDTGPASDTGPARAAACCCAGAMPAAPVGAHRPLIQVTIPITTMLGMDQEPADLAGYGPIPAPVAREIALDPSSVWRRLLTDPTSGQLLEYGRTCYRPPAAVARHVRARDRTCRHPGCTRPAVACEIDHVLAWQDGGVTGESNLCALCDRHHDLKHQPSWHVELRADRSLAWTTPTGHTYTSHAADYRIPTPTDHGPAASRPTRSTAELFATVTTRSNADEPPPF